MMKKKRKTTDQAPLLERNLGNENKRQEERAELAQTVPQESRRFACVFAKRFPPDAALDRVCLRPGFSSVARLKEHLYRKHNPIHCMRCLTIFATETKLQEHLNAPERCSKPASSQRIGRLDAKQIDKLKQKTRGQTEEDRWRKVYKIVFPEVEETKIPGPYCEASGLSPYLTQMEDFFRRRTIPETERVLSAGFTQFPVEVTRELPHMVLSTFENLFTEFRLLQGTEAPNSATQSSQVEHEMEIHPTFEYFPSGSSATERIAFNEQPEATQSATWGAPQIQSSFHSEWLQPNMNQDGQINGLYELSHSSSVAAGNSSTSYMPDSYHAMLNTPFTFLDLPETVDTETNQFDFGHGPELGSLEESQP